MKGPILSKKVQAAVLSVALGVVLLLLMAFVLLPYYVKGSCMEKLAEESGLRISCRDVSSRGLWLKFHDFSLCSGDCTAEDPLVLRVSLLRLKVDIPSLVRGRIRPAGAEISGLDLRVDLSTPRKSEKLAGAVARLESMLGRGAKGKSEEGRTAPGGKGGMPETFPVSSSDVNLDILFPFDVRLRSSGASSSAVGQEDAQEISLGCSVFTGPHFSIEADDLRFRIMAPGKGGVPGIGGVTLLRPFIEVWLPEDGLDIPIPAGGLKEAEVGAEPEAGVTAEEERNGMDAPGSGFFENLRCAFEKVFMTDIPMLPASECRLLGGKVAVYEKDSKDPVWKLEKVAGAASVDQEQKEISLQVFGNMELLPFKLAARGNETELSIEADLPVISLEKLQDDPEGDDIIGLGAAKGDINGTLTLDLEREKTRFEGRFGIRELDICYHRLASEPVRSVYFSFSGAVEGTFAPLHFTVGDADMSVSGVPVVIESMTFAEEEKRSVFVASGTVPATDCQKLFSSLPFEMRRNLSGFRFDGVMSADFDFLLDFDKPGRSTIDFDVRNDCEVVEEGEVKISKLSRTFVHEVEDRFGKRKYTMGPGSSNWVDYGDISPYMISATITCEDGAFYHHNGVSAFAIKRAVKRDLELKGFYQGGSTITMQLSKNLFLSREKTIARKLQEIILSWWLERSMDKDNIMELYLNVVEFGPEIYGLRNASMHYFGKEPADLDVLESIFLAKMLPDPVGRYKYYKGFMLTGKLDHRWRNVLERVAGKMAERGYIGEKEHEEALASKLTFYREGFNPYGEDENF